MIKQVYIDIILWISLITICDLAQGQPSAYSGSEPVNYVRSWEAVRPELNANSIVVSSEVKDFRMSTQYFDGLGRPLQTVVKKGSLVTETGNPESAANAVDMVTAIVYDEFGREAYKYLPFGANSTGSNTHINDGLFKLNPFQQQTSFMWGQYGSQGETYFYGRTNFEASPLNRVMESFAAGNSWAGSSEQALEVDRRSVKLKYYFNTITDSVSIWTVSGGSSTSFGSYAASTSYPAGELSKMVTVDEHNKQAIEFKDKEGKVVLRKVQLTATADDGTGNGYTGWLCIYYIYDELNNLRCVIQPEGVKTLSGNGWSWNATLLNEQCFQYSYNERQRMTLKKVPGAGEVYMVYDARDRLVMMQDANMRGGSPVKWLVMKYDILNRPVETGIWENNTSFSSHLSAAGSSTDYPSTGSGYTALTITHYDDYTGIPGGLSNSFDGSWSTYFNSSYNSAPLYVQEQLASSQTLGLVTWTQVRVINTSTWITSVNIYDEKGRVIQVKTINATGGTDVLTTQYNWADQPLIAVTKTQKTGTNAQTSTIITRLSYDELGRLIRTEKKAANSLVNSGNMPSSYKIVAELKYDAFGQLKKKKLAPGYGSSGLETENFEYNIRGWILGMNRDYAKDNNQDNYFGFDLGYDKANNGIIGNQTYANPQYNGNIEGMVWKSKGDGEKRKYDFAYDASNRLLKADFTQYAGSVFNTSAGVDFSMKMGDGSDVSTAYDANGNIKKMQQWGLLLNSSTQVDNLSYSYQSGSNKLGRVTDGITTDNKVGDFNDGTNTGTDDYDYDGNGNLTVDNNKSISGIAYNYLNLPATITIAAKGTIEYTYDAAGNKLKKIVTDNTVSPAKTTTTLYMGGAVYQNDTLQFIGMEEGRIRFNITNASLQYDYMLKDHLGNVRAVLTEEQQTNAYPVASMETAQATNEEQFYSNITTTRTSRPFGFTDDGYTSPNDYVAKVRGDGNKIGPSIILKVMAGDKVNIQTQSYWGGGSPSGATSPLNSIVSALATGVPGISGGKVGSGTLSGTILDPQIVDFLSDQPNGSGLPKAYLNWVLLDEQFKYVETSSGASQVGTSGSPKPHSETGITMNKNGYLYVYVSNETNNIDVYFDNLQVTHVRGPLLEETHYYPFGLTMQGISSKALAFGEPQNKYKYNGIEGNNDLDINLYDAFYRNLDPQIGRLWQVDPITTYNESAYVSMQNNPISKLDWMGDYFTYANSLVQNTYLRMREENNNRIKRYLNELTQLDVTSADEATQVKVSELTALIKSHAKLNSQWDEMNDSDIEFHLSSETPVKGAAGDSKFSSSENRVNIRLGKSDKNISVMAHELRHGYGYIAGEMVDGAGDLYDMTDEVVAFNAGYLFLDRQTANRVVKGDFGVSWFKETQMKGETYKGLAGREVSITLNTSAAIYMKYFNDRLTRFMQPNKNNANLNMTVKDAINAANTFSQGIYRKNEIRYGEEMLKNRNL